MKAIEPTPRNRVKSFVTASAKPATAALTLLEVLVIITILAVLTLMLLPALRSRRIRPDWGSCHVHLRCAGLAFRQWAEDNNGRLPMQVSVTNGGTLEWVARGDAAAHFRVLSNYLNTPAMVWCPTDTARTRAREFSDQFSNSNLSYFVGADAATNRPAMLLAGDRNLTMPGTQLKSGLCVLATNNSVGWTEALHRRRGNILFVDGHVETTDASSLPERLQRTGVTSRLLIP
jgi:prepilin-type processing-associated H-X9-DG protein